MLFKDFLSSHLLVLFEFYTFVSHILLNCIQVIREAAKQLAHVREYENVEAFDSITFEFFYSKRLKVIVFQDALLTSILKEIPHLHPQLRFTYLLFSFDLFIVTMLDLLRRLGNFWHPIIVLKL